MRDVAMIPDWDRAPIAVICAPVPATRPSQLQQLEEGLLYAGSKELEQARRSRDQHLFMRLKRFRLPE